jgi:hypothetical protein
MKKSLLILSLFLTAGIIMAQETITGWTFPVNSGSDSLNADLGTTQNKTYDIRFEWSMAPDPDSTVNTITFGEGASTFAASTAGWDNGADKKFWSIKFKANNYSNFKVTSKQKSDAVTAGPRDFKLQWRLSSGSFEDVPGGTVTVGSDWTTGVVTDLPVPITSPGTSSIYIRWIMTTNTDVNGGTVTPAGISMIDDITVTAVSSLGTSDILYTNRLKIGPVPNNGAFTVSSTEPMTSLAITDLSGKNLFTQSNPGLMTRVNLPGLTPGLYLLKVRYQGDNTSYTSRFVVE